MPCRLYHRNERSCCRRQLKFALTLILLFIAPAFGFTQNVKPSRQASATASAPEPRIVMEETMVPAKDTGIQIYVRNKHLASLRRFTPEKTLLFVHGAGFPAEATFDLSLDGFSWMDYVARLGYDVYIMDVRGYGRSTRPPEMNEPADKNPPIADTEAAVRDIDAAVDYVLMRRGLQKLDLLGWSWGTATTATYAASQPGKIERLVLYAPLWFYERPTPLSASQGNAAIGAYRIVTRDVVFNNWMTGVPDAKKADLIPAGWFDQWWNAMLATDPQGSRQNPPGVRYPAGVTLDSQRFWQAGRPTYDPAKITMPILMIQAEWDQLTPPYMSRALFPLLVNAPEKRYVVIGEGTHAIYMEKNRLELFREVQAFLDEGAPVNGRSVRTSAGH
jgi:pimeloyl-ACP methyl ester carboxylesterase